MNNINIFIGTYGHVLCLDHQNGNEIWRTSLPGVGYSPVSCFYEDLRVYCGANGKVFILCSKTGKILAQNEMVGQGYGFITFTTKRTEQNNQQNVQMPQQQFIPQIMPPPQFFLPQIIPQQQIINPQMMNQQILPQSQLMQPPFMIPQQQMIQPQQMIPQQQQMIQPQLIQLQNLEQPQIMMQPQFIQLPPESFNNNDLQPQTINFPQISNQNNNNYLKEDEELARLLDLELNGNPQVQRNNNNNNNNNNVRINNNQENFIPKQNVPFVSLSPKVQNVSVDDLIFVGLNSYVTALNKYNAQEVWKSYISSYSGLPMSIVYSKGKILVGATGNVYCFDSQTGKELWKNTLPGLRYTNVSIITTTNNNTINHSSPNLYFQGN